MRLAAHLPSRAPIDAYGNDGFRFAGMSHRGHLLILPDGMHGWAPADPLALAVDDFAAVIAQRDRIGVLLLGTGERQVFPALPLRRHFIGLGLPLEAMDTGAAVRTYNVLLAEGRPVAAALVAVARARAGR